MEVTFSDLLKRMAPQSADINDEEKEMENLSTRDRLKLLRKLSPPDVELLALIEKELDAENWIVLSHLIIVAGMKPSPLFLNVLFRIVDIAAPRASPLTEDAVHIISGIVSPETPLNQVEKLDSYLLREFPDDINYATNRKGIWALERIATPRAIEILEKGLHHPDPILREDIEDALKRLRKPNKKKSSGAADGQVS